MSLLGNQYLQNKKDLFECVYDYQEFEQLKVHLADVNRFGAYEKKTYKDLLKEYPHYKNIISSNPEVSIFYQEHFDKVSPFLQSPFLIADGCYTLGPWEGKYKNDLFKIAGIDKEYCSKKRIIDIGCNAGYDSFYLSSLGAAEVIGVEPSAFFFQAIFNWVCFECPNLKFLKTGWQGITSEVFGAFDLVNCQGILYHEPDMIVFLERLFDLTKPGGQLLLETHVTLDNGMSARFIEGDFWQDNNWWWIPDIDTILAMLRTVGFIDPQCTQATEMDSKNPLDAKRTIEGEEVGGRACFLATRPLDNFIRKQR